MSSKNGTSGSSNTDSGSYSGGQGTGGANQSEHDKRQAKLQANINKLKAKGATKESIAGLEAKKTKEAKKFEFKTTGVAEGKKYVAEQLGLVEKKAGPMDYLQKGATTGIYASKNFGTKGGIDFYGEEASAATDKYLEESGVPKHSQLWQELKYGISGGAMGSGDPTGILSSTAISQPMWESQKNLKQMIGLGMAAVGAPMAGQIIYSAAKKPYNEYLKSFFKKEIVEPIKYHVLAKRYLVRDKKYFNFLSEASRTSLKLQGGPLNNKESSTSMSSTSSQPMDSGEYLSENYGQNLVSNTSGTEETQYDADTTAKKRKHHIKSGAGGIDVKGYNLFAKTNQTISGAMSS